MESLGLIVDLWDLGNIFTNDHFKVNLVFKSYSIKLLIGYQVISLIPGQLILKLPVNGLHGIIITSGDSIFCSLAEIGNRGSLLDIYNYAFQVNCESESLKFAASGSGSGGWGKITKIGSLYSLRNDRFHT